MFGDALLGDFESKRNACPLFRNLGDPSIDWERWRALIVTLVGDRAMRLSQTYESNWHETPCTKTVDHSCTHAADLPAGVLLCPESPRDCVRVFTCEKARQAHRSRAHGHRAMARDFVCDEQCPACGTVFGSRPMAIEHLQCRAQILPRPSAAVVAAADEHDRAAGLTKCTRARFPT